MFAAKLSPVGADMCFLLDFVLCKHQQNRNANSAPGAALAALLSLGANLAYADNDFIVYSPSVIQGQSEVEVYGFNAQDARNTLNGASGYNIAIAHTFTRWWKAEVYVGQFNRAAGGVMHPSGYELENTFQLTSPGEYWANLGLVASYAHSRETGVPSVVEFGPLFEKMSGHITQRLNFILGKQVGGGANNTYALRSAYSVAYNINAGRATYSPGIEAYIRPADNAYQIGPVFSGELRSTGGGELGYRIGVVFGVNHGAPDKTLLARLEYEFF
jgi:hypothetical protein